ncbi:MAG: signal recognition particle protein [Chloroflexota bacterium]
MFETLTVRLNHVFDQLRRRGKLGEADVDAALREVRLALLEADVHFGVAKRLIARVRDRAVGAAVSKSLNPAQQVVKIVHEEFIATLGAAAPINLSGPKPRALMVVGLQGSGKTTAAGKLARVLQSAGERVMLAAGDPYRPAAAEQLQQLGKRLGVDVFAANDLKPAELARAALEAADRGGYGILILDTAGRSQLSEEMMDEVAALESAVSPVETLLVLDAMLGQEAINIAEGFLRRISVTGLVMTKMDGDARGGAAISVRSVTGIPIKYLGTGEKLDALEKYDPTRLASRILGMGDMIGLIEKAESVLDGASAQTQAEKMLGGRFDLEDWLGQIKQVKKMGPLGQIADMLPGRFKGAAQHTDPGDLEKGFRVSEAIINSMTPAERRNPDILNASRRRRIAAGSGTGVQDVNRLIRQFREAQKFIKALKTSGAKGMPRLFG